MTRQEQLEQALRDAVDGKACWLPRARAVLAKTERRAEGKRASHLYNARLSTTSRTMEGHRAVVDRILDRAEELWHIDRDELQVPTDRAPDPDCRREVAGCVWACMSASVSMGVPRKAVQHIFSASVSTVDRARRLADHADVLALVKGAS